MGFFVGGIPEEELEFWFFDDRDGEVFFLLSEGFGRRDRHILEEPEGTRIADAIGTESVDRCQSSHGDLMVREGTLDIEYFFREIGDIVSSRDRLPHCLLERRYSLRLDREPCSLTMSTISDKKMLAFIQELDQIAPLRSTTGSDGEFFFDFGFLPIIGEVRRGIL